MHIPVMIPTYDPKYSIHHGSDLPSTSWTASYLPSCYIPWTTWSPTDLHIQTLSHTATYLTLTSHTIDYPESNGPLQQYILFPFHILPRVQQASAAIHLSLPLFLSTSSFGNMDPLHCLGSCGHLGHCAPLIPTISHPHHRPCHPHTPPLPCHHCCCLSPSLLHTLPHPCCFAHVPLLQMLAPPCKVLLQPINELAGLILKWEALLQLEYFSNIPQMSSVGRKSDQENLSHIQRTLHSEHK